MTFIAAPRALVVDASASIDTVMGVGSWRTRMEAFVEQHVMLFAPSGFPLEVANGLLVGQRRPVAEVRDRMRQIAALEIELSDLSSVRVIDCVNLAARHGLTVYDAAYLHLALELEGELATSDKALAKAARAEGLIVHD